MDGGHGHVTPRADGTKARCGGPGLCPQCSQEAVTAGFYGPAEPPALTHCPHCGGKLPDPTGPVRATEG